MMKKLTIIIILAIAVALTAFACSKKPAPTNAQASNAVTADATVEVSEDSEEGDNSGVEIQKGMQKLIGVKTAEVKKITFKKVIRAVGKIEYDERKFVTVNTKVEGWIEKLYVNYMGQYVKKGDPLVELYSPDIVAAIDELLLASKWANADDNSPFSADNKKLAEASRRRLRLWDVSDKRIKEIEDGGKPLRTLTIYSPVSGFVIEKMALQGMKAMPGEKLYNIADLSTLWVVADVYEFDIGLISVGQKAKIRMTNLPGVELTARVEYIYPTVTQETRTVKVRLEIPNPGGRLKPQMFTDVEIAVDLGKRLAVPSEAVIETGTRKIIYVSTGGGYFEPREVLTGVETDGLKEIRSGVKAGERVVSSGAFLVDSEAQLKGITPVKK